jgi:hypothetical protein
MQRRIGERAKASDGLLDFSRTNAPGADFHPAGAAVVIHLDPLKIGIPAAVGHIVGVAHVVPELGFLTTDFTNTGHCPAPRIEFFSRSKQDAQSSTSGRAKSSPDPSRVAEPYRRLNCRWLGADKKWYATVITGAPVAQNQGSRSERHPPAFRNQRSGAVFASAVSAFLKKTGDIRA